MWKKFLVFTVVAFGFSNNLISQNLSINKIELKLEYQERKIKEVDSIKLELKNHLKNHDRILEKRNDEVKALFSDANQILLHREKTVDWWLTGIAIMISLITILFSFIIFFVGRKFYKDINDEKEKLKVEMEQFKRNFRLLKSTIVKEAREMNAEAKTIIEELKTLRTHAQKIKKDIDELGEIKVEVKDFNKPKSRISEIEKIKSRDLAQSIAFNKEATEFQRVLASAYDYYFSDNYTDALEKYLEILNNYKNEMTVSQLANIFFKIGYSYLSLENYKSSIEYFEKSLDINKNDYESICNIGYAYQSLFEVDNDNAHLDLAVEYYNKAIQINPQEEDDWLFSKIAEIYAHKLDFSNALIWYDKAFSVNKNEKSYLFSKIEYLIFNNQIESAKSEILKYTAIYPKESFDILYNKVLIEIIEGTEKETLNLFNELRLNVGTNIETTDWDFQDFSNWLDSSASDFVSQESKQKLKELNDFFKKWKEAK